MIKPQKFKFRRIWTMNHTVRFMSSFTNDLSSIKSFDSNVNFVFKMILWLTNHPKRWSYFILIASINSDPIVNWDFSNGFGSGLTYHTSLNIDHFKSLGLKFNLTKKVKWWWPCQTLDLEERENEWISVVQFSGLDFHRMHSKFEFQIIYFQWKFFIQVFNIQVMFPNWCFRTTMFLMYVLPKVSVSSAWYQYWNIADIRLLTIWWIRKFCE